MIYNHIEQMIGNTPIYKLEKQNQSTIYVKLEMFNIGGSIKDRVAMQMIDELEKDGKINKDTQFVEATSGNTGIGLALICASRGYSLTIIMPENMSKERIDLMKAFGASIILTDAKEGMEGAEKRAASMAKDGYIFLNQFENEANVRAHYLHTSKEIIKDFPAGIDFLITTIGTSGTMTGLASALKKKWPKMRVFAVEPFESAVLSGEKKGPHGIQGIGAGFVPPLYDKKLVDQIIKIKTDEACRCCNELAKKGLLLGISSGACICASRNVAKKEKGKTILCISPDGGIKYLSTGVFK